MKKKNRIISFSRYFLMVIGTLFLSTGVVAGEDSTYYYSSTGNNIDSIMYTEVNWQDCTSAKLIFDTKYDIPSGDHAYVFISNDLTNLYTREYIGTESNWNSKLINWTDYIGFKYIGFYYITDKSGYGDGFCIDNIQLISPDLNKNLLYDDGENGDDLWSFEGGFILIDDSSRWINRWIGTNTDGGRAVTTTEVQDSIHHWQENILVDDHSLSIADMQIIIDMWQ
ncbi:MAG: immune inhibitor A [Methanosarcinales archaeon]|nr:immune inhibitor A [Methanosarcinales archaeon]